MKLNPFQKIKLILIATINLLIPLWPWYRVDWGVAIAHNVELFQLRPGFVIFIQSMGVAYTAFLYWYIFRKKKEVTSLKLTVKLIAIFLLMFLLDVFVSAADNFFH